MGLPLLDQSFDKVIFYPYVVTPLVKHCSRISPNTVTVVNFLFKYLCLKSIVTFSPWNYFLWSNVERVLDCLDGEIARTYDKKSRAGHYLDKVGDAAYRFTSAYLGIRACLPLLQVDLLAPGSIIALSLLCPGLYVYEFFRGRLDNLETSGDTLAIYLEDNGTLLNVLIPILQAWTLSRCCHSPSAFS